MEFVPLDEEEDAGRGMLVQRLQEYQQVLRPLPLKEGSAVGQPA